MEDEKFNEEIFDLDIQFEKFKDKVRNNPDLQRELLELKSIEFTGHLAAQLKNTVGE
jgi:hypothetical protein